jgi:dihydroorotase
MEVSMPELFDLVIRGGTVVAEEAPYQADVGINNGAVAALRLPSQEPPLAAAAEIDARGKHVLPGVIDCHVHFRQPGYEYKEDWATGTIAAAFGGVTTALEMPSFTPPTDSVERFLEKRQLAESLAYVDFGLYALVSESSVPNLIALHEMGATGFKCYLSTAHTQSTSNAVLPISDGSFLEAFEALARAGARCAIHAENGSIVDKRTARLKSIGRMDAEAHAVSRPPVCAIEAVTRSITFAEWTGAKIHIAHEGTAAGIDAVSAAKARGVDVTVETCPQYLLLSVDDLRQRGGIVRCNPPVRDEADQARLWQAIRTGEVDIIATDHAPHTPAEKRSDNIWHCECGIVGVETALPIMLTEVANGRISVSDYVRIASINPAKVWRLYPRKGTIRIGSDADIVIVDLDATATINQEKLHSKSKVSAWHGKAVKGLPVYTLVRGKVVVANGELVGEPGWGRYVTQTPAKPAPRNQHFALFDVGSPLVGLD